MNRTTATPWLAALLAAGCGSQAPPSALPVLSLQRTADLHEQCDVHAGGQARLVAWSGLRLQEARQFTLTAEQVTAARALAERLAAAKPVEPPADPQEDAATYAVWTTVGELPLRHRAAWSEDRLADDLRKDLAAWFSLCRNQPGTPTAAAWLHAAPFAEAMGLPSQPLPELLELCRNRGITVRVLTDQDRDLLAACATPGRAVPATEPLRTEAGKPLVCRAGDALWAVHGLLRAP